MFVSIETLKSAGVAPNDLYNVTLAEAKRVRSFLAKADFVPVGQIMVCLATGFTMGEIPLSYIQGEIPPDIKLNFGIYVGGASSGYEEQLWQVGLILSKIKAGGVIPFLMEEVAKGANPKNVMDLPIAKAAGLAALEALF